MLAKAKQYQEHARECIRMAEQADSEETRDRLLELARIWMNSALIENRGGRIRSRLSSGSLGLLALCIES
jgi:hypothetical protein